MNLPHTHRESLHVPPSSVRKGIGVAGCTGQAHQGETVTAEWSIPLTTPAAAFRRQCEFDKGKQ